MYYFNLLFKGKALTCIQADGDTPHLIRSGQADAQNEINPANERRFVRVSKAARTHWAMGVLEMESDLVNLSLED
jgi:hypothetical protein